MTVFEASAWSLDLFAVVAVVGSFFLRVFADDDFDLEVLTS